MNRTRQFLALLACGIGTAAALLGAPVASAEPYGGGGADNPLVPGDCMSTGGIVGGGATDCAEPGDSQIVATPGLLGAGMGMGFGMGWGW